MTKSPNQIAIEAFAAHFNPPLQVVATRNIGGSPVHDGWMCALHIPELEIGFTATAWGKGYFKAWVEMTGLVADATEVAALVKGCLILANAQQKGKEGAQAAENLPATQVPEGPSSAATDERRDDLSDLNASLGELAKPPFESLPKVADSAIARAKAEEADKLMEQAAQISASQGDAAFLEAIRDGRARDMVSSMCQHDFQYGAAGVNPEGYPYSWARKRCWKCGVQEPKLTAPSADATKADAAISETAAQ